MHEHRMEEAEAYVRRYFPSASDDQVKRIGDLAIMHFDGVYSPDPEDWPEGVRGSRTGLNFKDFVVARGWGVIRDFPVGIERDDFRAILVGDSM